MALIKVKPTSAGRRAVVKVVNPDLHKGAPYAPLLESQSRHGGRNHNGHITVRHQGGGRIVLVSSIGGVIGIPFQAFYSASKFAMEGYGEALAYEVAPFGIQVTLLQPGNVSTDFTAARRGWYRRPQREEP